MLLLLLLGLSSSDDSEADDEGDDDTSSDPAVLPLKRVNGDVCGDMTRLFFGQAPIFWDFERPPILFIAMNVRGEYENDAEGLMVVQKVVKGLPVLLPALMPAMLEGKAVVFTGPVVGAAAVVVAVCMGVDVAATATAAAASAISFCCDSGCGCDGGSAAEDEEDDNDDDDSVDEDEEEWLERWRRVRTDMRRGRGDGRRQKI